MKKQGAAMSVRRINVALQGGGAHGAFTWGVLDRLLQDETIEIAGISGTSAGALNGAALKAGLVMGGRAGARENLDWLWQQVGAVGDMRMAHWFRAFQPLTGVWNDLTERFAPFAPMETWTRLFSPYDYGWFYSNPLAPIAEKFHLRHVCAAEGPAFFVAATNVRTGKIRVFSGDAISSKAILASACLPTLFQAVEIDDPETGQLEAYWDGGYTGNPALFPLFDPALPRDIVVININPLVRDAVPRSVTEVQDRINEISFNASLLAEFRAIHFVNRLIATETVKAGAMKDVLVHLVADDALMESLTAASKVTPWPGLLLALKEAGQAAAERFLEAHHADLNVRSSVDLAALFG
jgi:NTE family protein